MQSKISKHAKILANSSVHELRQERIKQHQKWGEQNHAPLLWLAILGEEVGEANKSILENDISNYRQELIQVAAVAIAAVESLDRTELKSNIN